MQVTIHKNHRRPRWWPFLLWPWIGYGVKGITRSVFFDFNCKYDLPGEDDDPDVNKIFGLGYFPKGKESARFGWNYNIVTGKINVFAYYHRDGVAEFTKICEVLIGVPYMMILNVHDLSYSFSVVNMRNVMTVGNVMISKLHTKKFSYRQGLYFGGTQKAPHDITIEIKKL
jgi:hypothetical protein